MIAGVLGIADPIKATTPDALQALRDDGMTVVMLTGDNWTTARAVAKRLGITEVEAEILPEDKSKVVSRLREELRLNLGDGVNQAADFFSDATSIPSRNVTPLTTFGN